MTEPDRPDINVEAPIAKDKEEISHRGQEVTTIASSSALDPSESVSFLSQIQGLMDEATRKSRRAVLPKAWDRFPLNRLGFLSRSILRFYEFLFRDQRDVNFALTNAVQTLASMWALSLRTTAELSRVEALEERIGTKAERTEVEALGSVVQQKADLSAVEALDGRLDGKADRAEVKQIQRQITDHKYNIVDLQRRLIQFLEETRTRPPEGSSSDGLQILTGEGDGLPDAMYVSFEDRFRGTRDEVKQRQQSYLPYVKEASSATETAPVLDLGCGRGEWLEILRDHGYTAKGVDLNPVMVDLCRGFDLKVIKAEVAQFLREQKSESFGVITAFHLIEHLTLGRIISLIDESLRLLRSGGAIILETPNPENMVVGACNFYLDPTHRNPLPPRTMAFLLEGRGFVRVEIMRLHSVHENCPIAEDDKSITARFNELFYGPQDYAVIGWKA